ncbi:exodeoxyribonuclease VII small subunit [Proteiniclasticum ruminis]|jgi:exodeoxyribonuclease VII small subunit|uniref:Exodeoxyribonuclease 7 small subunit n=1 Tax=Proteiniclasticum ruminis TaxID=398199 RepID=A0A1G8MVU6_9CLOT|nr:exodeoxyribonuclease VII small subunit [Proteiniclasticum ruminis]MBP9921106.1 exodeoxyribonuclease VII small subunit [Proteiniclasticum sp.]SDI71925.1 exodeoxyribonuclease VII small subunit [Proteiniclasticum ruminis]
MAKKVKSYKELTELLEEVLQELEGGELSVEESMKKYEEGVSLTKELLQILEKAEAKVKMIQSDEETEF